MCIAFFLIHSRVPDVDRDQNNFSDSLYERGEIKFASFGTNDLTNGLRVSVLVKRFYCVTTSALTEFLVPIKRLCFGKPRCVIDRKHDIIK